jgi:hypothetical protein
MAIADDVQQALTNAGNALKNDLWEASDAAFLAARALDLVGLEEGAASAEEPTKKAAYLAAAQDTVNQVKLLALMRMEAASQHVVDAVENFFVEKVIPLLIRLLPALVGM